MSREYHFVQVDVFTDRIFGGNPLAVVVDARGLRDDEMQAIAREMNLSETTFVLPPTRPDCAARVRIFTPDRELPFAGHPTLGTAGVLADRAMVSAGTARFALEEGVGPVPVELAGEPGNAFVWMAQREATFGPPVPNRAAVAHALGLGEADLLMGAPIRAGSSGLEFLYVPLCDRQAVDRATLDVRALLASFADAVNMGVFVFAPDPSQEAGRVYSRMFAPHMAGIPEDPASGSASGPLGAYLVRHGIVRATSDTEVKILSEQGTKMGRRSLVHVTLRVSGGRISDIKVGGGVVPVHEGRLS
jgi:trans-2,3-dihydro-3-hydroxyanthranilate isomerase